MQAFRRTAIGALLVAVIVATTSGSAFAQATGRIDGLVTDQSAGVLPGVTLEVTNIGTNDTRTTVSGADGLYTVPQLAPGKYKVTASLAGFKSVVREGITVNVNQTARVDVQLEVGAQEETITVTSDAPLVETRQATLGVVIDQQQVVELPLNGRNFTQLGTLIPGVVAPPAGLGGQAGDATPGGFGNATGGFNVNGMRNQSNNFLLDGASNNDTFNTGFVLRPPPDAIQEFKIMTHSFGAEYGRNAGSVVNVVTKSGTNEWHGSAWEFNRTDALQAYNFFAPRTQPKPKLKQNQFGGAVGGPLMKNKLFVFGYYEGFRNKAGNTQTITVLSQAQRRGDFSGTATLRDPLTGLPFAGNVIPADRLSPVAVKLINDFLPLPNVGANRYTVSPTVVDNRHMAGFRGDYRLNEQHSVLARYMWSDTERTTPRTVQPVDQQALATLQDVMGAHTWLLGANKINVARVSFNRIYANPQVTSGLKNADYGINLPNTNPLAVGLPSITVTGFFTLGDLQQPFVERVNNVVQFIDDFTWLAGNHSIKIGAEVRREAMKIAFINRPNGDLTFNANLSGSNAADFLLGIASQARATTQQAIQDGYGWAYAGFVQDEYRVNPHLTLNLGVRYELTQPFVEKEDRIAGFFAGQQSTVYPNAPRGLVYPGDQGVPRGVVQTDKNNVAPRLSAVWDPTGNGRTSIRAAWGIFYDALAGQGDLFQSGVLTPPFTPLVELNTPTVIPIANPLALVSGSGPNPFPQALTIIGWGNDFQTPYAQHFNLTFQREFFGKLGIETGYVGSRGHNLPIFMEVNPQRYTPGQTTRTPATATDTGRVFPAFALVRPTFSVARSWYDSFQTSARMRPAKGFSFLASYTLSHAVDHVSGLNIGGEARPILPVVQSDEASINAALDREKGDALFDARHRFVLSFAYALPAMSDKGALMRNLVGGWQFNGIVQGQTGFPLTVLEPALDIRNLTFRPDVTCDPNDGPKTVQQYFDTSCFSRLTLAQSGERNGNEKRNQVRGPGFKRADLSLFKNFALGGAHQLQVRIEAFNVLNQARFGQPGNILASPTFGVITTAEDGRVVQLGVKYTF